MPLWDRISQPFKRSKRRIANRASLADDPSSAAFRHLYQIWLPPFMLFATLAWMAIVFFVQPPRPPVGAYIASLALVVAVVTIWPPESNWSKAAWLGVFFCLTGLEIGTLYRDRSENNQKQAETSQKQQEAFTSIGKALETSIANSNKQFSATIDGLQKTLNGVQETIINTTPSALLQYTHLRFLGSPPENKVALMFNIYFQNRGNTMATHVVRLVRFYIGKIDDRDTQQRIMMDFNTRWGESARQRELDYAANAMAIANHEEFFTVTTDPFRLEEAKALYARGWVSA